MEGSARILTNAYQECAIVKLSHALEGPKVIHAQAISIAAADLHVDPQLNGHLQHNA